MAADSAGQRNSLLESFSRRIEVGCFAWASVESPGYGVELGDETGSVPFSPSIVSIGHSCSR